MRTLTLIVDEAWNGSTVKHLLPARLHMAEGLIARVKLRETGLVRMGERVFTYARLRSGDVLSDGERACEQLGRNAALCRWPRARRGGRGAGRRHGARTGREHQAQPALRAEL